MIKQKVLENKGISDHLTPGYQHHDALWFHQDQHITYKPLAGKIWALFPDVKNILEIGCGAGSLAYWLRDFNKDYNIVTLDGNKDTTASPYLRESLDKHFIIRTDEDYDLVETSTNTTIKFDLVVCYEHLEHIEKTRLDKWIEMLNKHTHKGSVFLGSASHLDYNPRVHVTLESRKWWGEKFGPYGWREYVADVLNEYTVPFNFEMKNSYQINLIRD